MGDSSPKQLIKDAESLRALARERIENGVLPRAKAARTWGGHGSNSCCSLCDQLIGESEPEMELEFDSSVAAQSVRFHLQCHSMWDAERRVPEQATWTPIEQALPPMNAPVEAKLVLGAGRTVILSIARASQNDKLVWINATTQDPLPEAWRPTVWRYLNFTVSEPTTEHSAPKRA